MQVGTKLGLVEAGWNSGGYFGRCPLGGDAAVAVGTGGAGSERARVAAGDFAIGGEPCIGDDADCSGYSSGGYSAARGCWRAARKLSVGGCCCG
jgi:hypothetical protein